MTTPEISRPLESDTLPRLEFPKGKEALPQEIDTIFWDVDGTITTKDIVDTEIAKIILQTANQGITHNFVTGRDRFWLVDYLKAPLVKLAEDQRLDVGKILSNMGFYPELGLILVDPISDEPEIYQEVLDHPLISGSLRERIANFFLQPPHDLKQAEEGQKTPPRHYIIKDANGVAYFCPLIVHELNTQIRLPDFIWSETKELIGTAEVVRDVENRVTPQRRSKILLAAGIIRDFLKYWGYDKNISLSPVSTAINIAPILDGIPLDKDWAAGRILQQIQTKKDQPIEELARKSIGIGDGYADFLFSRPRIGRDNYLDVAFVFIGAPDQHHNEEEKTKNLVVRSQNYSGPKATLDVLRVLKDRFVQK